MVGGEDRAGYDIVQETWRAIVGDEDFDKKWNRVLHDGVLAGSELPEVVPGPPRISRRSSPKPPAKPGDLELVFLPSSSLHDGRFANNGWLQELPDPLTKLTWDNPALVSPKTAETLGVANEDVVRIDYAGRSLELPVWVLPGMADNVVALTLGYGRSHAGRVGSGVGFDTFTLRGSKAPGFDSGVKLTRVGRAYAMSSTQHTAAWRGALSSASPPSPSSIPNRPGRSTPRRRMPVRSACSRKDLPSTFSLWKEHTYDQGHQWGMTIDLNSCIGCNACMVACQSENNVPVVGKVQVAKGREMHWIRVDRYFSGEPSGNPEAVFQPVPCMQCEDAPANRSAPWLRRCTTSRAST
jgi:molybdopterin-containing oxidoreductase family iron-sulfur binding subunit